MTLHWYIRVVGVDGYTAGERDYLFRSMRCSDWSSDIQCRAEQKLPQVAASYYGPDLLYYFSLKRPKGLALIPNSTREKLSTFRSKNSACVRRHSYSFLEMEALLVALNYI